MDAGEKLPFRPDEAVSYCMEHFGTWVLRLAALHLTQKQEAEDITQEVFLRVYQNWTKFRGESSLRTWLGRITVNLCRDHFRRYGRELCYSSLHEHTELEDDSLTPEEAYFQNETTERIGHSLKCLDELDRSLIMLFYYFDLTAVEISHITDVRVNTVRSRLMRARGKLKQVLKEGVAENEGRRT